MFAMNIFGFWLSPCSPWISELAKSAILTVNFLTNGILDVIRVSSLMIISSFFMPMIMTASTAAIKTATAVNMFTTRLDSSAWADTRSILTMPMLNSPIRSKVRSTTIEDKPGAKPVSSFSPNMYALANSPSLIGIKVLTIEPMAVDQNVFLMRTVFLTGVSRSFHRIALRKYAGGMTAAVATSQSGEAEPMAAPISSIPVHQIKATSKRMPTTKDTPILIMFFLLEVNSIHLSSWIK